MIGYYDANMLVKLYVGHEENADRVEKHANSLTQLYTAEHSRAEVASALFRKFRDGEFDASAYVGALHQFQCDVATGFCLLLPATSQIYDRIDAAFSGANAKTFLRGADALHLATAAQNGFMEIFSDDKHLLAASALFGISSVSSLRI